MAFSDYKTLDQVQKEFTITLGLTQTGSADIPVGSRQDAGVPSELRKSYTYQEEAYLGTQPAALSQNFLAEMEFNRENIDVFASEGARSEAIIFPVLREIYKQYHDLYALWIQKSITYNEKLTGTPDYMIAKRSELGKTVLAKPFVIVVEAKRNDFEQGWAQCLAELIAAQKLNGESDRPVHGIVTDGKL